MLPPLIDRDQFFGDPEIAGAQISPDGVFIAFLKPFQGTRNLWVKRVEESFDRARAITADRRPIPGYFWSRDGKFVLFVQDRGGDENYNVYAVDPAAPAVPATGVPAARNLTEAAGVRAAIVAVPRSDPDALYVGLNDRDPAWHDLYKLRISTGERVLVAKNTDRLTGYVFDLADTLRLTTRSAENGDTELLRLDPDGTYTKIYSCTVFESCSPLRFHQDGRLYVMTNRGEADLARLVLLDLQTSREELVESDPLGRVDLHTVHFSERTDEILATEYVDDRTRFYWKDGAFAADYDFLTARLPGREIGFASGTADERLFLVSAYSDTDPGATYLFDRQAKTLTLQYRVREQLPRDSLAPMTPIRYPSSDGLDVPAYLTLPKGLAPEGLPLVVVPHGGPWARDTWGYNPFAQFLANRGYAVLQPNFRGSTGYGKKFLDAGNRQWGEKMQDDLTWGVRHLVAQRVADPRRIGILGGSYGGYATLAGVAFTPALYAAAVSIVGPSNLITLLDSIPPYWEAVRTLFHERMGDPSTPEGRERLDRQSPLNSAANIRTPLMVIQGANDPRVKKRESDQIVVALRDRGFPVEYIVAPDEGHGFARPENSLATFAAAEAFLAKYLNGRFQESMTPELAAHLKELTVDPRALGVAGSPTRPIAPTKAPAPGVPLVAGTWTYGARIGGGAGSTEVVVTTEVREAPEGWLLTSSVTTPGGEVTERAVLDRALVVKRRTVVQGPLAFDVEVQGGRATGRLTVAGRTYPIAAELGGELFADGTAAYQVIATLPLAPGYTATFRNFDVQAQKERVVSLEVAGRETVTVPAGTFDALKVELTTGDDDRTTVWVDAESRTVAKVAGAWPQMPGATIAAELQQQRLAGPRRP